MPVLVFLALSLLTMSSFAAGPNFFQHPIRYCRYVLQSDSIEKNLAHLPRDLRSFPEIRNQSELFIRFIYELRGRLLPVKPLGKHLLLSTRPWPSDTRNPEWLTVDFNSSEFYINYHRSFRVGHLNEFENPSAFVAAALFKVATEIAARSGSPPQFSYRINSFGYTIEFGSGDVRPFTLIEEMLALLPTPELIPLDLKPATNFLYDVFHAFSLEEVRNSEVSSGAGGYYDR